MSTTDPPANKLDAIPDSNFTSVEWVEFRRGYRDAAAAWATLPELKQGSGRLPATDGGAVVIPFPVWRCVSVTGVP